jgi:hypothetical protein
LTAFEPLVSVMGVLISETVLFICLATVLLNLRLPAFFLGLPNEIPSLGVYILIYGPISLAL